MKHQTISFIKSGVRLIGYGCLAYTYYAHSVFTVLDLLFYAGVSLGLAEVVGIVEEIGHE